MGNVEGGVGDETGPIENGRRCSFGSRKCWKLIRCVYAAVVVAWEVSVKKSTVVDCCSIQYCAHWLFCCEVRDDAWDGCEVILLCSPLQTEANDTIFKLSLRLHLSVTNLWRHSVFQTINFLFLTRRVFRVQRRFGGICCFFCLTKKFYRIAGVNHNHTLCVENQKTYNFISICHKILKTCTFLYLLVAAKCYGQMAKGEVINRIDSTADRL